MPAGFVELSKAFRQGCLAHDIEAELDGRYNTRARSGICSERFLVEESGMCLPAFYLSGGLHGYLHRSGFITAKERVIPSDTAFRYTDAGQV